MPPDPVDLRVKRAQADINEALGVKPQPPDIGYGRREDGTPKGRGFYGMLPRTDGLDQSSELSIGVNMDGRERTIPSMVPGLNAEQLRYLLSVQKPMRPDITQKAVDFAVQRQQQGKGPFAEPNEEGAYRVPRYASGGSVKAKKKTPADYITDAIADGLAVLPAYKGNERKAYQKAKAVTGLLDWTPAGIPQAMYDAGEMIGLGVKDRSVLEGAGGLGMAALAVAPGPKFWHGTPSGILRPGPTGLHVGTEQAAKDAVFSRIGFPAKGTWDGKRQYGDTILAGRKRLMDMDPRGYNLTGYNARLPDEDFLPDGSAKYGDGSLVPRDAVPDIFPLEIVGPMTNTPHTPRADFQANGLMKRALKAGNAKRGFYYKNDAEDAGSISAVVPSGEHLQRVLDFLKSEAARGYAAGGHVKEKRRTPSDYVTDAIASGLGYLPAYRGDERAAYQRAKDFTGLLDWTPAGIPEALYQAGDMLGRGVRDRSALGTAGGLGMAAIAGLPIPGKKAIKNAVKKSADLAVSGLKDIRPPTDDAWSVIRSNFDAGRVVGDETVPLDKLSYGVSVGEQPQRVKDLAAKISGPDGYFSRPIVDQAGNVLEGQHRVSALASLGVKDIPVRRVQDLFADIDRTKLVEAIKGAGKVAPEHANQIASHIAEMAADAGGAAKVAQEFDLRGPFEKHFLAGLKAIDQPTPARSLTVKELAPPPALAVEPPKGIRAYHGSPHAFDKFDLSKIGTGEGAQSYGHGLYFAENEGVARSYRDQLSGVTVAGKDPSSPEGYAVQALMAAGGDPRRALAMHLDYVGKNKWDYPEATQVLQRWANEGAPPVGSPGHMYEVNIAADPAQFLDWDNPLSVQSPHIQEVAKRLGAPFDLAASRAWDDELYAAVKDPGEMKLSKRPYNPDGANFYESTFVTPGAFRNRAHASQTLLDNGIPGIKYLDQGSRNKGEGTRNFVVFKPDLVDILKRYAVPVAGAGTAASALAVKAKQPQEEDY